MQKIKVIKLFFDIFREAAKKSNPNEFIINELNNELNRIKDSTSTGNEKFKEKINNLLNHEDINSSSINLTNIFKNIS